MAKMFPPTIVSTDEASPPQGEIDVFEKLAKDAPNDWIVLHSIRLKTHEYKKSGEADFVVITDRGVLVLEVKGGNNFRNEDHQWVQRKSGEKDRISNESPFGQAAGAYFALRTYLKKTECRELVERNPWGWGVVFPHCVVNLPNNDPEFDLDMLLDQKKFPEDLTEWINKLIEYWKVDYSNRNFRKHSHDRKLQDSIPERSKAKLLEALRPRFTYYSGLGQITRQAEQSLLRLTEKQCLHLLTARNNDRTLIEGAAGTGKTFLAFEFAKERATAGERILMVCFNANLANALNRQAEKDSKDTTLSIVNYHQLIRLIRKKAGLKSKFVEDWTAFNESCFEQIIEALEIVGEQVLYDRIIMDEGQDLMSDDFLNVLDVLLKGGLFPSRDRSNQGGKWLIAMDRAQIMYSKNFSQAAFDNIGKCSPAKLTLTENCRNTRPVALHVYGFSKSGSCDVISTEGPDPVIDYYKSGKELTQLLRSYINTTLLEYSKIDKPANHIALLTTRKELIPEYLFEESALSRPLKKYLQAEEGNVIWETVHGFKGLEASTVIMIGLDEFNDDRNRLLMYVGGSRAKTQLIWLLPSSASEDVQKHLIEARALASNNELMTS